MGSTGWDNFWKGERKSFYAVMKMATRYFVLNIEKIYHLKPADEIFDYGCGPGFVADSLAPKKIRITGADINEFFIEECRRNHPDSLFTVITTDTTINKKILEEQLSGKRFDYILFLSVTQYLKSVSELEDIIKLLSVYMKEQGMIIVSDVLDENTNNKKDVLTLLIHCIKKGRIGAFIGFIYYLLFSDYRTISKQVKLLRVSEQAMRDLATRNNLSCEKVHGLTLQKTRSNYILSFTPVK
ncbi:class I SAM-dependent methyltransferase [Niastella sp. OAS944]|uniref:class I SAM-dependent methyltransferase n=1 Tax=Niastella sp. OAS944 TaxID=2664089 RepID=UPI003498F992|nr:2-polyprenyl-3-methyl-5-hydroxy-6-metoxy-1,4-benzoquinol methylase [Chitinophagaceae bacterium OAS944]